VSIRPAETEDIPEVARIYKSRSSAIGLASCSQELVENRFEELLSKTIFLVSGREKTINGFVVGGDKKDLTSFRKRFVTDHFAHLLMENLFRPRSVLAGLKELVLPYHGPPAGLRPQVKLLALAVIEAAEGLGIASRLLQVFECFLYDCPAYELTVDMTNYRAINFYFKNGFRLIGVNSHLLILAKNLSPTTSLCLDAKMRKELAATGLVSHSAS
jgi:ribosomal protein S18 acetylase RimI-like enzyme